MNKLFSTYYEKKTKKIKTNCLLINANNLLVLKGLIRKPTTNIKQYTVKQNNKKSNIDFSSFPCKKLSLN